MTIHPTAITCSDSCTYWTVSADSTILKALLLLSIFSSELCILNFPLLREGFVMCTVAPFWVGFHVCCLVSLVSDLLPLCALTYFTATSSFASGCRAYMSSRQKCVMMATACFVLWHISSGTTQNSMARSGQQCISGHRGNDRMATTNEICSQWGQMFHESA